MLTDPIASPPGSTFRHRRTARSFQGVVTLKPSRSEAQSAVQASSSPGRTAVRSEDREGPVGLVPPVERPQDGGVTPAAPADIEFAAGAFRIAGTDRAITLLELAAQVRAAGPLPDDLPQSLDVALVADSPPSAFPNGCHVAEVEIDPETGVVRIVNYVAVDDFGVVLNPMLVAGQVHGGPAIPTRHRSRRGSKTCCRGACAKSGTSASRTWPSSRGLSNRSAQPAVGNSWSAWSA